MSRSLPIIAIDFDGTIVEHAYPSIGAPVPGAIEWMKRFQEAGARLVLLTTRSEGTLTPAVEYCRQSGVEFWQVNDNPEQSKYTSSRKVYAHAYIDDLAIGTPLKRDGARKPFVDWEAVGPMVMELIQQRKREHLRIVHRASLRRSNVKQ